jgi:hypothetical protein
VAAGRGHLVKPSHCVSDMSRVIDWQLTIYRTRKCGIGESLSLGRS